MNTHGLNHKKAYRRRSFTSLKYEIYHFFFYYSLSFWYIRLKFQNHINLRYSLGSMVYTIFCEILFDILTKKGSTKNMLLEFRIKKKI